MTDKLPQVPGATPPESLQDPPQAASGGPKIPGIRGIGAKKKRASILTQTLKGRKLNRKWMLVGGITLVGVIAAATMLAPTPPVAPKPVAQVHAINIVPNAINNASFDKDTERQMRGMQENALRLEHNQKKLGTLIVKGQTAQKSMQALITKQQAQIAAQRQLLKEQAAASRVPLNLPPPPPPPTVSSGPPPYQAPPPPSPISGAAPAVGGSHTTASHNGFGTVLQPSLLRSGALPGARMVESIEKNPYAGYIPAGSFMPAVLLTGIEANTASSTQGNPEPVLMRVQRRAIIPNEGMYNLSDCFVLGSATGSISARRADIRLTTLSCTNQKRRLVLQATIKGYAVDSDGKFGLRGTLVERRGALLEKSLLAGFASGLGMAMQGGNSSSYSGSMGTGMVTSGLTNGLQSGAMYGISNSMNQLAQFYLNQAKNIFPVIEVPPGRKITLVLVKGSRFVWHTAQGRYILVKHPVKLVTPAPKPQAQHVRHTQHHEDKNHVHP